MKFICYILLAGVLLSVSGCAPYGLYEDKRLMDTITDDKTLATSIKTRLLQENFKEGWGTAVYCYYNQVFLVGEVPPEMQPKALEIARSYNPHAVTTHWFTPQQADTNDYVLAAKVRGNLISAKGISSTRIDTEVNSGRVVLLGVVSDEAERQLAIDTAQNTEGVTEVTSYLMLPM